MIGFLLPYLFCFLYLDAKFIFSCYDTVSNLLLLCIIIVLSVYMWKKEKYWEVVFQGNA